MSAVHRPTTRIKVVAIRISLRYKIINMNLYSRKDRPSKRLPDNQNTGIVVMYGQHLSNPRFLPLLYRASHGHQGHLHQCGKVPLSIKINNLVMHCLGI